MSRNNDTKCKYYIESKCSNKQVLNKNPDSNFCKVCSKYDGPSRGLGDTVHSSLVSLGISAVVKSVVNSCNCEKRREKLNEKFPYSTD